MKQHRERVKMTIEMDVTQAQGLALQAMFKYWNYLAAIGSSRRVGFYVDGDGNFHPNCTIKFDEEMPELTKRLEKAAVTNESNGDRQYDFDPIAWLLNETPKDRLRKLLK